MSRDLQTAPPAATPAAEIDVTAALVRRLLVDQHPDLAALPVQPVDAGWDNAMFRLGVEWAVRLPRREMAAALIEHEQTWLPHLAPQLPVAVPAPERIGRPACGYPWRWSVLAWLPGEPADLSPLDAEEAARLADFLRALHVPAAPGAPANPFRGVPLADRRETVEARLERLAKQTTCVSEAVLDAWQAGLAAPAGRSACWVHGDLHARNVLVSEGALTAVIDWGDLCRGDPATDLAAVWMLLDDPDARSNAIRYYGPAPEGAWLRALGWAVSFGTVLLETGIADHPRHAQMGRDILRRIADGPAASELADYSTIA